MRADLQVVDAEGYSCTTATSGEAATTILDKSEFHLVLADIMMPGMSGVICDIR